MNASGLVLVIGGAWLLCQVFGGNALGRLGITGAPTTPAPAVSQPMAPGRPNVQVGPGMLGG